MTEDNRNKIQVSQHEIVPSHSLSVLDNHIKQTIWKAQVKCFDITKRTLYYII